MIKQLDLWDEVPKELHREFEARNGLGPFESNPDVIRRHFDCVNYNACLTYVTNTNWRSFSCAGCHRAKNIGWKE